MTSPELTTSLLAGLIGLGLGAALMAWDGYRAERAGARPALLTRLLNALDRLGCNETVVETLTRQQAQIRSLQASLDDANGTIARISAEKAALVQVIQRVKGDVGGY